MVACVLRTLKRPYGLRCASIRCYFVKRHVVRCCLVFFIHTVLLSAAANAASLSLAPGLEISLPSALRIDILESPDQAHGARLVGEIDGAPGYFIAATKIQMWERDPALWNRLESEIRKQSNTGSFLIKEEGSFVASPHDTVNFKTYEYVSAEQKHTQVYFLLRDERNIYWLTLTLVEGVDLNVVLPITQALIRRVSFKEAQMQ